MNELKNNYFSLRIAMEKKHIALFSNTIFQNIIFKSKIENFNISYHSLVSKWIFNMHNNNIQRIYFNAYEKATPQKFSINFTLRG